MDKEAYNSGENQTGGLGIQEVSASFDGKDVSPTMRASNGTPGFGNTEIFSQGGAYLARTELKDER